MSKNSEHIQEKISELRIQLAVLREIRDNRQGDDMARVLAVKLITEILEKHPYLQ